MKKANQTTTLPSADVLSSAYITTRKQFASDEVLSAQKSIDSNAERIEDARHNIQSLMKNVATMKGYIKDHQATIDTYDWSEAEQQAKRTIDILARFPWLASIEEREGKLLVRTKLLFQNIRVSRRDETARRVCVGSFAIMVDMVASRVRIKNELWSNMRFPHWSIDNHGSPCWGDWGTEVRRCYSQRDIVGLFTLLRSYLLSTDDGSAYVGSHEWADDRAASLYKKRFRTGNYAVLTRAEQIDSYRDDDGISIALSMEVGTTAEIISVDRDDVRLRFTPDANHPLRVHTGYAANGYFDWWVPKRRAIPLTKAQVDAGNIDIESLTGTKVVATIDELPDGSLLKQANDILKTNK